MSLKLFGCNNLREKIEMEKEWLKNDYKDCPVKYDPEAGWRENAVICRLSLLKAYCDFYGIYQILNREFNNALAEEIKLIDLDPILIIGKGYTDLAKVLNKRGVNAIAMDVTTEGVPFEKIKKYKPRLIIYSWLPVEQDLILHVSSSESVVAQIFIGEEFKETPGHFADWTSRVLKNPNRWSLCRLDNGVDFKKPELWWRHSKVIIYERLERGTVIGG